MIRKMIIFVVVAIIGLAAYGNGGFSTVPPATSFLKAVDNFNTVDMKTFKGKTGKLIDDLTNIRFGNLTAIEKVIVYPIKGRQKRTGWICECDCGNKTIALSSNLKNGFTKSCGCERIKDRRKGNPTHGKSGTSIYRAYHHMIERCTSKNDKGYNLYGGRGIIVCDRWMESFENFYEDMGDKPTAKHSLDRTNVNGNYDPNNCRWATQIEQANNKRNNILITHNDKTQTISEWSTELNVNYNLIHSRLKKGYTVEDCFYKGNFNSLGNRIKEVDDE